MKKHINPAPHLPRRCGTLLHMHNVTIHSGAHTVLSYFLLCSSSFAFSQNSRLKKTLSSAGLYPAPDVAKVGARLKTQATGSMAAFSSGASGAVLTKGGGDAM